MREKLTTKPNIGRAHTHTQRQQKRMKEKKKERDGGSERDCKSR